MAFDRAQAEGLKLEMRTRTLSSPNVVTDLGDGEDLNFSTGIGLTETEGVYKLAIRVANAQSRRWVDEHFKDVFDRHPDDIDIREVGAPAEPEDHIIQADLPSPALQELTIGMRIRHERGLPGTLGFFARRKGRTKGFVSNNHVIARRDRGRNGDKILAAQGDQVIGKLARFHRLKYIVSGLFRPYADCAFARAKSDLWPQRPGVIPGLGPISPNRPRLTKQTRVRKIGSPMTAGMVTACHFDRFRATFENVFFSTFDDVIEIESREPEDTNEHFIPPFATGGDSGSLVVTENLEPIGMLFYVTGGGPSNSGLAYANPISRVEDILDVRLIDDSNQ